MSFFDKTPARGLLNVTLQTFLLLRRDRVFVPAVVAGVMIAAMANLISDWSVEDFSKILYDVGAFGFHVTGNIVAIFWGTKIFGDARTEGSLEVQLAAPINRTTWLTGKFLGLSISLVFLWLILLVFWQGLMKLNYFGWLDARQGVFFIFQLLGWLVVAAIATFFSSFCSATVALFSSFCLWLAGIATALVAGSLSSNTPEVTRKFVEGLAQVWDLQQFNLVRYVVTEPPLPLHELGWRASYGVILILLLITTGSIIFSRRDVIS